MKLKEIYESANTGLDAIKRAPILDYKTNLRCIRIQDISQLKSYNEWGYTKTTLNDYKKFKLKKNDILVARTGATVGVSYIANKEYEAVFNNGTIRLRLNNLVNPHFIYYIFQSKEFKQYIENVSCVSTQPNLKVENLLRFEIPEYDKVTQDLIVDVLLKYDEFIENNNKRISMLEQMAEEIYKEWFVRFRFPEYSKYDLKKAKPYGWIYGNKSNMKIPSKWHFGRLEELGKFVRGKNITSAEMKEGEIPVVSAGIEPSGYHNESNVKGISLTMSASGANAGYLKYNLDDIWAADCSYYQNDNNIWFVYSSLKFIESAIKNLQVGSAQPHVYAKNINKLNIIIPEEKYIKLYNYHVSLIFKKIKKLKEKNKILIKQRDLLLPRLMSGKLEVK